MKICIAQTKSIIGDIQTNIQNHLQLVCSAIELNADLIIFPELSITNYEPNLAKELATTINDPIFEPFQKKANENNITIGIGMPILTNNGINISVLIFQPNKERSIYSKQLLHEDELPYFTCGNEQTYLNIKGKKIALGICYETLQPEHFINANKNGADIYITSVAKPKSGIEKAYLHFPTMAKEFETPILMVNSVGFCDNFLSVGKSAVWNSNGILVEQLDEENQGILVYNTELETAEIKQLKIEKGQLADLEIIFEIYLNAKRTLDSKGINQWTNNYPTSSIIENDLNAQDLFVLKNGKEIIGAIGINENQDQEYEEIDWQFNGSKVLVIHRLVIHPRYQRKGYAKLMMNFAESFAKENQYTSIRLDAYSLNKAVLAFYRKQNYFIRGKTYFPERVDPFFCMEKEMC